MDFLQSGNLEPEEVPQLHLRGFEKDACFYSVLIVWKSSGPLF